MSQKRDSTDFETHEASKLSKYEESPEISTEDLEEAMTNVKKMALKGRKSLIKKAKALFLSRNGESATEADLENVFNTLRDMVMDEDTAKSSSDESSDVEEQEELTKIQQDMSSALENARDLGKADGLRMKDYLKKLWAKESNGTEISQDEMEAVLYDLKHKVYGVVVVEEESETEDEDYEPTEEEQTKSVEDKEHPTEQEHVSFDFKPQCVISEETFEKLVSKFIDQKGRSPSSEETDALVASFSTKLSTATFDDADDSDYEAESSVKSEEDSDMVADNSLEKEDIEMEEGESESEHELTVEPQSDAFQYMEELEEGSDGESSEEEAPEKKEEATEKTEETTATEEETPAETSKVDQAQELTKMHPVCA